MSTGREEYLLGVSDSYLLSGGLPTQDPGPLLPGCSVATLNWLWRKKDLNITIIYNNYIYYYGQESLRRNALAIMVNKRVQNAVLGCNLKNNRMISVRFQGKSFNITVIQVYAPTSNAEEADVERFYEDL